MLTREAALRGRRWFLIDARGKVLGRLASEVAEILRGKLNPKFTPYVDCGDFVVIVNAEQVQLTGKKNQAKFYFRHSGYPGGLGRQTAARLRLIQPERLLQEAVAGMLPKNRLGRRLATKLKIYSGGDHPHAAQQPITIGENLHAERGESDA